MLAVIAVIFSIVAGLFSCPTLPPREAAAFLGLAEQTLSVWRSTKRYDLPYIKVGRRIRYRLADLEAFLKRNTVTPAADEQGG
jgi:hypothetical protein